MEENLFTNTQKTVEKDYYREMLEKRTRPELANEDTLVVDEQKVEKETTDDVVEEKLRQKPESIPLDVVLKKATEYFNGDSLAANVWVNKYALKDSDQNIYEETPDQMHRRLASEIARIERKYPNPMTEDEIYALLKDFKYIIPAGSPMAGIGNNFQVSSLSNCFVIGSDGESDSYGGVMKEDQEKV